MSSMYSQRGLRLPRLQHASLGVPSNAQEAVRAFYGGVIGLKEKTVPYTRVHAGLVWFAVGDSEMELHFVPDPEYPANPAEERHICLEVDDLDLYRRKITEAGCKIFEANPIAYRPRFFCHDPFGNRLEFTTIQGNYLDAE